MKENIKIGHENLKDLGFGERNKEKYAKGKGLILLYVP